MFKARHSTLVFLSGFSWLAIGCFLLAMGLNFIIETLLNENGALRHPVLNFLSSYMGGMEQAAMIWILFALFIGYIKGKYVFSKTVQRSIQRIQSLPNPVSIGKIYPYQYYLLIGSMIFLGFLVRFAPLDIRGGVDVLIGFALINGAALYFQKSWTLRRAYL